MNTGKGTCKVILTAILAAFFVSVSQAASSTTFVGITQPRHESLPAFIPVIAGTAQDEIYVSSVQLTILDWASNRYWDGAAFSSVSPVWLTADYFPNDWSYTIAPETWVAGSTYTATARASDHAGDWSAVYATSTFVFQAAAPTSYEGCDPLETREVGKSGYPYAAIQEALDSLTREMYANACVIIKDGDVYAEAISIQGFTNNGYRLTISGDPSLSGSWPRLTPAGAVTAVFDVRNSSVAVANLFVVPSTSASYGIAGASDSLRVVDVTVTGGAYLGAAGIQAADHAWIQGTVITAQNAKGLVLTGAGTMISGVSAHTVSQPALYLYGSSDNYFELSEFFSEAGYGAQLLAGSNGNSINFSTIAANSTQMALNIDNSSFNSLAYSLVSNSAGDGAFIGFGADHNTVYGSTLYTNAADHFAVKLQSVSSVTIDNSFVTNPAGVAYTSVFSTGSVLQYSTVTSGAWPYSAVFIDDSAYADIKYSYVRGANGVYVRGSPAADIRGSVLAAADAAGSALHAENSADFVSDVNVLAGGSAGRGAYLLNNPGTVSVTSNTILSAATGIEVSSGEGVYFRSDHFESAAAGGTAILFSSGVFVSTLAYMDFASPSLAVNVNGASLGAGSRLTMANAYGARTGEANETDPFGYVDWDSTAAPAALLEGAAMSGVASDRLTVNWVTTFGVGTTYYVRLGTSPAAEVYQYSASVAVDSAAFIGLSPNTGYYGFVSTSADHGYVQAGQSYTLAESPVPAFFSGVSYSSAEITCTAGANPAGTQYLYQLSSSPSFSVIVSSLVAPATSAWLTGLAEGATYYGRVVAFNGDWQYSPAALIAGTAVTLVEASTAPADAIAPTVDIASPANGTMLNALAAITGTAADNVAVSSVAVNIVRNVNGNSWNGSGWVGARVWLSAAYAGGSWSFAAVPPWISGNNYTLAARAQDSAGNFSTANSSVTFFFDSVPPITNVLMPANGSASTFTYIGGTAVDGAGPVVSVELYIKRLSDELYWSGTVWESSRTWHMASGTGTWSYAGIGGGDLTDGAQYLAVSRAYDLYGNVSDGAYYTSTFTYLASTAPAAGVLGSAPMSGFSADSVTVNWTTTFGEGTTYYVRLGTSPAAEIYQDSASVAVDSAAFTGLSPNTVYYGFVSTSSETGYILAGSGATWIETPANVYFDMVGTNSIVASAYAPVFTALHSGNSGINVAAGGVYGAWNSTGTDWVARTGMITGRSGMAAAVSGKKIYAIGGFAGVSYQNKNEEYDPVSNTWATRAPLPVSRAYMTAGAVGGKIYAVGGWNGSSSYAANYEYDPAANAWSLKAAMPTARYNAASAVVGGELHVMGGMYLTAHEAYDPATDTWAARAPMPTARGEFAAAAVNGRIYAAGGWNGSTYFDVNEEYDPASDSWAVKAPMSGGRSKVAGAAIGGKFYVVGGANGGTLAATEAYDPATDAWLSHSAMPTARNYLSAAAVEGKLYAIGGAGSENAVEAYEPGVARAVGGLQPNTMYLFKAKARNQLGDESGESPEISTYTLAAAAPAGAVFTGFSGTGFTLNWSSGSAAGGYNGPGAWYLVEVSTESDFSAVAFSSYTYFLQVPVTGLTGDLTYYSRIQAINSVGATDHSWTVLGSTMIGGAAPQELGAAPMSVVTGTGMTVNWTSSYPGGTAYYVRLTTSASASSPVSSGTTTGSSYAFSGLAANTEYFGYVSTSADTGYFQAGAAYTLAQKPAGAHLDPVYYSSGTFYWDGNGNPAWTSYGYIVSTELDFSSIVFTGTAAVTSVEVTGLSEDTTYYGRVRAVNGDGVVTDYASAVPVTTLVQASTSPAGGLGIDVFSDITSNGLTMNWATTFPGGTVYYLRVATAASPSSPVSSAATAGLSYAFAGLAPNTTYYGFVSTSPASGFLFTDAAATLAEGPAGAQLLPVYYSSAVFTWLANGNPAWTLYNYLVSTELDYSANVISGTVSVNSANITGLSEGTTYYGMVRAINSHGIVTNYASAVEVVTLVGGSTAPAGALGAAAFSAVSTGAVTVNWTTSYPGGTAYYVRLATFPSSSVYLSSGSTTASSAVFGGLSANKQYFGYVSTAASSGFMASGSAYTLAVAPTGPYFSVVSYSSAAMHCAGAGNPSGTNYQFQLSVSSSYAVIAGSVTSPVTNGYITGLSEGTTYYGRVRAQNGDGVYTSFAEISASTVTLSSPPVEGIAPTIAISAPTDGYAYYAMTNIVGTAADNTAVTSVQLLIRRSSDGKYWDGATFLNTPAPLPAVYSGPGWSYNSAPVAWAPGDYNVTAFANDAAGNWGSASSTFTFVASGSGEFSTAPISGVTSGGLTVNWGGTFDGGTVYYVRLATSPSAYGALSSAAVTSDAYYSFTGLSPNTEYFGFVSTDSVSGFFLTDSVYTLAESPAPAFIEEIFYSSAIAGCTAGGNPAGTVYRYQLSVSSTFATIASSETSTAVMAWLNGLSEGTTYYGRVAAFNGDGIASAYALMTGSGVTSVTPAPGDGAVPTVSILSPVDGAYLNALAAISGTAADNVAVSSVALNIVRNIDGYSWNGGAWAAAPVWVGASYAGGSWSYAALPAWIPGYNYTLAARAQDSSGSFSAVNSTVTFYFDNVAPITNVLMPANGSVSTFTYIGGTAIDGGGPVVAVELYVKRLSDNYFWSGSVWGTTQTWHTAIGTGAWTYNGITGAAMTDGGQYLAVSRAYDVFGNVSNGAYYTSTFTYLSGASSGTITAAAFSGVGSGGLTVNWNSTYPGGTVYSIHVGTVPSSTAPYIVGGTTAAPLKAFTGLGPNTLYYGFVSTDAVTGFVQVASGYTLAVAPSTATIWQVEQSSAVLTWSENSNPAGTMYSYEYAVSSGFAGAVISSGTAASATLTGLAQATTYYARVRAMNGDGFFTAYSTAAPFVTLAAPVVSSGTISAAAFSGVGSGGLTVNWNSTYPGGTVYSVRLGTIPSASAYMFGATTADLYAPLGGLDPNTLYYAFVSTYSMTGFVQVASGHTLAAVPSAASVGQVYQSSAVFTWSAGANPAGTLYSYEHSVSSGFAGAVISSGTAASAAFTGLTPGATYYARVRARNGDGFFTAYSTAAPFVTLAAPVVSSGTISAAAFSGVGSGGLTVNWNSTYPGGTVYSIHVGTVPSSTAPYIVGGTTAAPLKAFTGLAPNTLYYGFVSTDAVTGFVQVASGYTLAVAPSTATIWQVEQSSAVLTWSENSNPAGTMYSYEYAVSSGFAGAVISSGTAASATLTGLAQATTYYARVRAMNGDGFFTAYSTAAPFVTLSALTPSGELSAGSMAYASTGSLTVSWSTTFSTSTVYYVRLATQASPSSPVASVSTLAASYGFTGLNPNTTYYGFVSTSSGAGFMAAGGLSTQALMPSSAAFSGVYYSSVTMSWNAGANPAWTVYNYRLSVSSGFVPLASSGTITSNSVQITGLSEGTTYYGSVSAISNGGGGTGVSYTAAGVTRRTAAPAGAVTGITATVLGSTSVQWTWNSGSVAAADGYRIMTAAEVQLTTVAFSTGSVTYIWSGLGVNTAAAVKVGAYNAAGTGALTQSSTYYTLAAVPAAAFVTSRSSAAVSVSWADGGNPGGTLYQLARDVSASFTQPVFSTGTALSHTASGLSASTTYYFKVRAFNGAGVPTSYGAAASTVTLPALAAAPAAPAGAALGVSSISWTWSAASGATAYKLYHASGTLLAAAAATPYSQAGLLPNTTYSVRLAVVNESGEGALSAAATPVATLANPPTGASAAAVSATSATVTWDINGNPADTAVRVLRYKVPGAQETVFTAAGTSYTDKGLIGCTSYYYRIWNLNRGGIETARADTAYILTGNPVPAAPTNLFAEPLSGNRIQLTWEHAPYEGITAYKVYYDAGDGSVDYSAPIQTLAATQTSYLVTAQVNTSSAAYKFGVRAVHRCGVEETNTSVTASAPSMASLTGVRASIKIPQSGKRVNGNSVTVMAELVTGTPAETKNVLFQYKMSSNTVWSDITARNASSHPNPDTVSPYFIHWDVSGVPGGSYDLRAKAATVDNVADAAPAAITITVDSADADINENSSGGAVTKEQKVNSLVPNTVQAADEASAQVTKLLIPAGAIDSSTATVAVTNNPAAVPPTPADATAAGVVTEITLSTTLAAGQTADVTLAYPDMDGDGIVDGTTLRAADLVMYSASSLAGPWNQDLSSTVDEVTKKVVGHTSHFSFFALFAPSSVTLNRARAYPVPWRPGAGDGRFDAAAGITFDRLTAASVVRIFTITGHLVRELRVTNGSSVVWNGQNSGGSKVASGVYLAHVKSGSSVKIIKIAVER